MKIKLITTAIILFCTQALFASQVEQKIKNQNIIAPFEFYRPLIQQNIESQRKQLQQEAAIKIHPQRALLMFIDEQEKDVYEGGVTVWQLFSALEQKVAPILVSQSCLGLFRKACNEIDKRMKNNDSSLLSNPFIRFQQEIFAVKQNEKEQAQADEKIMEWIQKENFAEMASHAGNRLFAEALLAYRSFNPDEWLILRTNSVYLLVPHALLHSFDNNYSAETYREGGYTKNQLHQFALALGLGIDALEQVPDSWFTETTSSWLNRASQYLLSWKSTSGKIVGKEVIDNLKNIFIPRSMYRVENAQPLIPEWTIYLSGHGLVGSQIAGIHVSLFPLMLNFYEDKITVKLFLYDSCYAGGLNAQVIYNNLQVVYERKEITQTPSYKTYAYPIISAAIGDFPTYLVQPTFTGEWAPDSGKLEVIYYKNFAQFILRALSPQDQGNYAHIIEPIMQIVGQKDPLHIQLSKKVIAAKQLTSINAAQILLPGLSWFSVLGLQDNVISIGQILAATRDIQKPLDVYSFFKQQSHSNSTLKALLFYTREVPFALDMSTLQEPTPRIISMVPGEATHLLANLIATQYGLSDIAKSFVSPKDIKKWLIADTMVVKNDMPIIDSSKPQDTSLTISEVLITSQFGYFTYANESYKLIKASGDIQKVMQDQDKYKKMFQEEKVAVVSARTNATAGLISLSPEQLSHVAENLRTIHKKQATTKQQAAQI